MAAAHPTFRGGTRESRSLGEGPCPSPLPGVLTEPSWVPCGQGARLIPFGVSQGPGADEHNGVPQLVADRFEPSWGLCLYDCLEWKGDMAAQLE